MIWALAPMDGITNCATRTYISELFNKFHTKKDKKLWLFTEFMSAEWYQHNPKRLIHHLITSTTQKNIIAQIYWADEDALLKTALDIDRHFWFFDWIELNIWCPSPKVMACWAGAGMLRNKNKTLQIIKNLSNSVSKPFSIKTRCGLTYEDMQAQKEFIIACGKYCKTITIHGRTYWQSHSWNVNREFIYDIKKNLPDVKVIWNGWISWYEDGEGKLRNLDGVMFWQSAMMNPRIMTWYLPTITERKEWLLRHLDLSVAHEIYETYWLPHVDQQNIEDTILQWFDPKDYHSVVEFRKHLFWWVSWLIWNKEFKQKAASIRQYDDIKNLIEEYFDVLTKRNENLVLS